MPNHWDILKLIVVSSNSPLDIMHTDISKALLKICEADLGPENGIGEAHHRSLMDMLPEIIWIAEPDGTLRYCNRHWYEVSGLTSEEAIGNGWLSVLHPSDRERAQPLWQQAQISGNAYTAEHRLLRACDGRYRWHLLKISPLKNTESDVIQWIGLAVDIHEKKLAEAELIAKNEPHSLSIGFAKIGTWDRDLLTSTLQFSDNEEISGLTHSKNPSAEDFLSLFHPEDRLAIERRYMEACAGKAPADFEAEYRIIRPDGELRWVAARGRFQFAELRGRKALIGSTVALQDITARKLASEAMNAITTREQDQAEATLRASEARFRALIENSTDSIALFDADWNITYLSSNSERILGYRPEQLLNRNALLLVHPEDIPGVNAKLKECLEHPGSSITIHARLHHQNGSWRLLEGVFTNLLHNPYVRAVVNNYRDITEKMDSENALRLSEEKFRRAFRSNPDAMSITTVAEGRFLDVNEAFLRLTGYTRDELIGSSAMDTSWVDAGQRLELMRHLSERGRVESMEASFRKKNGEIFLANMSAEIIEIDRQRCVLVTSQDITEWRRAADELRRSEEQYRSLVELAPYGIFRSTPEGRILMVNSALVRMLGYETAEEVLRLHLANDIYEDAAEGKRMLGHGMLTRTPVETRWKHKAGHSIAVRLAARSVYDDQSRLLQAEAFVEDVTQQRAMEKQLQNAQKMEAIGQLAGGVAHDFNNLLMIMVSRAELIIDHAAEPKAVVAQAEQIVGAVRRGATLTRQLLACSRDQVLQPMVLSLNTLVKELGDMLPRLIGETIETRIITDASIRPVKVDRAQFEQVILNLAINARDAMPDGGQFVIETSCAVIDAASPAHDPKIKAGRYVLLSISDTGIGMAPEIQARIFEPFFTTKERGQGTGLGLAMVYAIVEQSGGYISVESGPGKGTTFRIYLPEVRGADRVPVAEQVLPALGGTETILLVEDEAGLRDVGSEFLRAKGYDLLVAENGADALNLLLTSPRRVDLLITDLIMPQLSGAELANQALTWNPKLLVIFMSGYSGKAIPAGILPPNHFFLQKPFNMSLLAQQVRLALDSRVMEGYAACSPDNAKHLL